MSTLKTPEIARASDLERDLRERLLRKKSGKAGNSVAVRASDEAAVEVTSMVSQISAQSIQEVDHLIVGCRECARSWMLRATAYSEISVSTPRTAKR